MDATEILERAADILAERGVHRGDFVDPHNGQAVCSLGAMNLAAGAEVLDIADPELQWSDVNYTMGSVPDDARKAWGDAHHRLVGQMGLLIPTFNDDPANSDEDIILCFKRAAHDG